MLYKLHKISKKRIFINSLEKKGHLWYNSIIIFGLGGAQMSDTAKKLKILICDDSALVRKQLSNILSTIGEFEIFFAENGNLAVTKYAEILPDLSFMDIVMPEKSGIDALKDIISLNPNAKVVMASSIGTQNNLKTAIENGAFDFIQKPIEKNAVEKIINKIV